MGSTMLPTTDDRRLHPRRAVRHPLTLETAGGGSIGCESVDVSAGGMKVRSDARVPLGRVEVVIGDGLALEGAVVEEVLDASTGEVTARIVFDPAPPAAIDRVVALPDLAAAPSRTRHRTVAVLAASLVAGLVVAGGAYLASRGGDDTALRPTTPAAASSPAPVTSTPIEPAPIDAPPHVAAAAPAPATDVATPTPATTVVPAPRTASAPAPAPTPAAPASRIERTDDRTRVVVGSSAEDTSVQTTTRPSPEGDDVRLQLDVTPEPDGTTLPVSVRLENRSTETLTFEGGLRVTVTATGAGDAATTLASEITQLAPGESVRIDGFLDFGATGEYDVSAATEVR